METESSFQVKITPGSPLRRDRVEANLPIGETTTMTLEAESSEEVIQTLLSVLSSRFPFDSMLTIIAGGTLGGGLRAATKTTKTSEEQPEISREAIVEVMNSPSVARDWEEGIRLGQNLEREVMTNMATNATNMAGTTMTTTTTTTTATAGTSATTTEMTTSMMTEGKISMAEMSMADGKMSMTDGKMAGQMSMAEGKMAGQMSMAEGKMSMADGKMSMADGKMAGQMSMADGKMSMADGKMSMADGKMEILSRGESAVVEAVVVEAVGEMVVEEKAGEQGSAVSVLSTEGGVEGKWEEDFEEKMTCVSETERSRKVSIAQSAISHWSVEHKQTMAQATPLIVRGLESFPSVFTHFVLTMPPSSLSKFILMSQSISETSLRESSPIVEEIQEIARKKNINPYFAQATVRYLKQSKSFRGWCASLCLGLGIESIGSTSFEGKAELPREMEHGVVGDVSPLSIEEFSRILAQASIKGIDAATVTSILEVTLPAIDKALLQFLSDQIVTAVATSMTVEKLKDTIVRSITLYSPDLSYVTVPTDFLTPIDKATTATHMQTTSQESVGKTTTRSDAPQSYITGQPRESPLVLSPCALPQMSPLSSAPQMSPSSVTDQAIVTHLGTDIAESVMRAENMPGAKTTTTTTTYATRYVPEVQGMMTTTEQIIEEITTVAHSAETSMQAIEMQTMTDSRSTSPVQRAESAIMGIKMDGKSVNSEFASEVQGAVHEIATMTTEVCEKVETAVETATMAVETAMESTVEKSEKAECDMTGSNVPTFRMSVQVGERQASGATSSAAEDGEMELVQSTKLDNSIVGQAVKEAVIETTGISETKMQSAMNMAAKLSSQESLRSVSSSVLGRRAGSISERKGSSGSQKSQASSHKSGDVFEQAMTKTTATDVAAKVEPSMEAQISRSGSKLIAELGEEMMVQSAEVAESIAEDVFAMSQTREETSQVVRKMTENFELGVQSTATMRQSSFEHIVEGSEGVEAEAREIRASDVHEGEFVSEETEKVSEEISEGVKDSVESSEVVIGEVKEIAEEVKDAIVGGRQKEEMKGEMMGGCCSDSGTCCGHGMKSEVKSEVTAIQLSPGLSVMAGSSRALPTAVTGATSPLASPTLPLTSGLSPTTGGGMSPFAGQHPEKLISLMVEDHADFGVSEAAIRQMVMAGGSDTVIKSWPIVNQRGNSMTPTQTGTNPTMITSSMPTTIHTSVIHATGSPTAGISMSPTSGTVGGTIAMSPTKYMTSGQYTMGYATGPCYTAGSQYQQSSQKGMYQTTSGATTNVGSPMMASDHNRMGSGNTTNMMGSTTNMMGGMMTGTTGMMGSTTNMMGGGTTTGMMGGGTTNMMGGGTTPSGMMGGGPSFGTRLSQNMGSQNMGHHESISYTPVGGISPSVAQTIISHIPTSDVGGNAGRVVTSVFSDGQVHVSVETSPLARAAMKGDTWGAALSREYSEKSALTPAEQLAAGLVGIASSSGHGYKSSRSPTGGESSSRMIESSSRLLQGESSSRHVVESGSRHV